MIRVWRAICPVLIRLCTGVLILWGGPPALGGDYLSVEGPCGFSFPRDHGAHSGYQTEWWYYTGNLCTADKRAFGFQLTFFRRQIVPPGAEKKWPARPSAWRTQNIFMAHAALSDITGNRFHWQEEMARGAAGLAGVRETEGGIQVFLGPWKAVVIGTGHRLTAATDRFSFDLMCVPAKPPVAHGEAGCSRKGMKPESASCYYSITRFETSGSISVGGKTFRVEGTAWMDHEYSTAPLEPSLTGWDWFSLQLADHTELMLYILRQKDGSWSPASSGTFIPSSGPARHLTRNDFQTTVMDRWRSPGSGAAYPCQWRITILPLGMDLEISSRIKNQELRLNRSPKVSYWEGSVVVKGRKVSGAAEGVGYVELTGYAEPFDLLGPHQE